MNMNKMSEAELKTLANVELEILRERIYELQVKLRDNAITASAAVDELEEINEHRGKAERALYLARYRATEQKVSTAIVASFEERNRRLAL